MKHLISVIVPIYNVEKYLSRCIDSILAQTYQNFELILVNDGSTDNSGQICDAYLKKDERIEVLHKANGGLSDARNAGIEKARGAYFLFVDSDDYIAADMLERLYGGLIRENADLAMCGFQAVDESGASVVDMSSAGLKSGSYNKDDIFEESGRADGWNYIVAWNKLYKKKLFDTVRFEKGKLHEDEFIFHLILDQCKKIVVLEEKLYYYLQRAQSITTNSYSVRRLDAVEANLLRCKYYQKRGMKECFADTEKVAFYWLQVGIERLEFDKVSKRFAELRTLYAEILFSVLINAKIDFREKIKRLLFCMSPKTYAKRKSVCVKN